MTDDNSDSTESTDAEMTDEPAEAEAPEVKTYEVRIMRAYETDFPAEQVTQALEQSDAETEEEAIEMMMAQQEQQNVAPQEKLTGLDAQVEEV